jgi:hypothetical protein
LPASIEFITSIPTPIRTCTVPDRVYYFLKFLAWTGVVWNLRDLPERVKYDALQNLER